VPAKTKGGYIKQKSQFNKKEETEPSHSLTNSEQANKTKQIN